MAIRVTKSTGSRQKTAAVVEFLTGREPLSRDEVQELKSEVGEFLITEILQTVGDAKSPISGESWKASLTKEYLERKKKFSSSTKANMELMGDMLDSFDFKVVPRGIEIGVFGNEAWKADGHNKLSGAKNKTPKRRFIPAKGQKFKQDIQSGIEDLVEEAIERATEDDDS